MNPFERWQQERYGDIIAQTSQREVEFENGTISQEERERWFALEEERYHTEHEF